MILATPGVILEICVGLMTLGQVSTDWTYCDGRLGRFLC